MVSSADWCAAISPAARVPLCRYSRIPQNPALYAANQHIIDAVGCDLDNTLAPPPKKERDECIAQAEIAEKIKEHAKNNELICYVTTRNLCSNQYTRQWLKSHDLPQGIILSAPDRFYEKEDEEARYEIKRGIFADLSSNLSWIAFYGDSPHADATAAIDTNIPEVHLLVWSSENSMASHKSFREKLNPRYQETLIREIEAPTRSKLSKCQYYTYKLISRPRFRSSGARKDRDIMTAVAKLVEENRDSASKASQRHLFSSEM